MMTFGIGWQEWIDNKWLNTNACNKHLDILEDNTIAAKKADAILGCIKKKKGIVSRSCKVIALL